MHTYMEKNVQKTVEEILKKSVVYRQLFSRNNLLFVVLRYRQEREAINIVISVLIYKCI